MSSELTIDIQLTELGFSSWGFQLRKQKDAPQTPGPASAVQLSAASSPSPSVENHVVEEEKDLVGQNAHGESPSSPDSRIKAEETEADATGVMKGSGPHREKMGTDDDDDDDDDEQDDQSIKDDAVPQMCEEHIGIRRTNGSWEMDVAVDEEEEEEEVDEDERSLTEDEDNDISSDTNGPEEHRCPVCDLTFSTPFLLSEHSHVHTGVRPYCCAECGKQFCHLANYRAHLRSHATFCCLICAARFATQELLQGHLDTNHFEKEFYQCDFCKRIFVLLSECEEHVQAHKEEMRRHPCPQCDRSFHHQSSLHRHLKWHKKSALICTDCGQAFPKKNALLRHSFSHLGLLPYTCVHCKQHFRLASLYRKHECKPEHIQCVACLGVYQSRRDFEKHKRDTGCWGHQVSSPAKTSDIRCMECGQVFGSSEELKKHAGTHQRVMKCSECGMGFRSSLMLMSHMGGHAATRPCLCKECGLGFPHQHAYDSHLKTCGVDAPTKASVKKQKPDALPAYKKREIAIAPKNKDVQAQEPQKEASQALLLPSVAPASNHPKPTEGPWTLVLNKEHLPGNVPLVMFLPTPVASTSESSQNSQIPVASTALSEKRLSLPQTTDIPLASASQGVLASISHVDQSDKPVLLQGMAGSSTNVLIPVTNAGSPKIRWTVLDHHTPGSTSNMHTMTRQVVTLVESNHVINMSQVNAENEKTGKVLSSLEISSRAGEPNREIPLCLVKVKTEPDDDFRNQSGSGTEGSPSALGSAALLTIKTDDVLDSNGVRGPSDGTPDLSRVKKEPEPWEEHEAPDSTLPHGSAVVDKDLCQCEICGIILAERNMTDHLEEHSMVLDSASGSSRLPRGSPPPGPPSKKLHLG